MRRHNYFKSLILFRRIKQLEECADSLKRQVANHKQEEETLLTEMEVINFYISVQINIVENFRKGLTTFFASCLCVRFRFCIDFTFSYLELVCGQ